MLEKSLFQAILLDLGMARMSGAVDSPFGANGFASANPWHEVVERADGESQSLPPEQSLADLYDEEGGSLLVLGEPGSGKTTSLLELAKGLLLRVETDPQRPVPVVFNLSFWAEPHTELDGWLVDELSSRYQIPRKIDRVWLAESRLLPPLDGLDELAAPRRATCVEAINHFSQGAGLVGAVVCCRLAEYIDLPVRLSLNAAVRLLPLSDEQVQGLSDRSGRTAGWAGCTPAARFGPAHRSPLAPDAQSDGARLSGRVRQPACPGERRHCCRPPQATDGRLCVPDVPTRRAGEGCMSQQSGQGAPLYSEEQITRWLT